jgi:hypothetical protein
MSATNHLFEGFTVVGDYLGHYPAEHRPWQVGGPLELVEQVLLIWPIQLGRLRHALTSKPECGQKALDLPDFGHDFSNFTVDPS